MGTNNINTNTTTHNAGFPPAPPETRQQAGVVKHFQTTFNCADVPCYAAVKLWAVSPLKIVIDSYELTAREADERATRLFSNLGALGCICNHMTQPV